jgi:hypothetical protein
MYGIGAMLELFDADEEEEFVEFDEFEPLLLDVSFVFVDTVEFEAGADVAFFTFPPLWTIAFAII